MNTHELPLVTFTILAQMSVGAFVVLGLIQLIGRAKVGTEKIDKLSDPALYAIGPLMILGLVASIFHLGNPMNAANSILGIGHSWLSREIFFGSAFAVMGAVFAFVQWKKIASAGLRQAFAVITGLVGLGLVYSMSMVYLLPTVPAWNSIATPIRFFVTTLLLGVLSVGAAFIFTLGRHAKKGTVDADETLLVRTTLKWLAIAAMVLVGISFVTLPVYSLSLAVQGGAAAESAALIAGAGGGWIVVIRLVLLFVGAMLIGLFLLRSSASGKERSIAAVAYTAMVMVLVAEVLGRMLFYASFQNVGF